MNIENSTGVIIAIENENSTIELITNLSDNDLNNLSEELSQLRKVLKSESKTIEHDIAIGHLAEAEVAVKKKDKKSLLVNLKKAGNWVFETATKIGVSVTSKIISEMIKNQ